MVEYAFDEAIQLLEVNKAQAQAMITQLEEDLAFLRDQVRDMTLCVWVSDSWCVAWSAVLGGGVNARA